MARPDQVTIPGAGTLTRRPPSMMSGTSIWPEWQKGLMSDKQMGEFMPHFAGGLYGEGGYQVRQPANPQQYGLLGSGDPRVWTAAENIMAQPGMQYGQSPGLLAQPPGQGGGGLLSNTPSGQAQAMPMGQMQGSPSGAPSGGLNHISQLPPEMISVMASQQQPQGMDPMQGNQVRPVTPSGIWDADADPSVTGGEEAGTGAFTISDLMKIQSGLGQANWGNQTPISAFEMFKDAGGGTFDVDWTQPYAGQLLSQRGPDGLNVPIHELHDPSRAVSYARERARDIDESN